MRKDEIEFGQDYLIALDLACNFFNNLRSRFGTSLKGLLIWGSVIEKTFICPVDASNFTPNQIQKLRDALIPIRGESKGSDIDITLFVVQKDLQNIAEYLSHQIDDLDENLRIEHIMVVPYEEVIGLLQDLRNELLLQRNIQKIKKKIDCLFVMSHDLQKRSDTFYSGRISETLTQLTLGAPYFEDAFVGFKYEVDNTLANILDPSDILKEIILKRKKQYFDEYPESRANFEQKHKRFEFLSQILKENRSI